MILKDIISDENIPVHERRRIIRCLNGYKNLPVEIDSEIDVFCKKYKISRDGIFG